MFPPTSAHHRHPLPLLDVSSAPFTLSSNVDCPKYATGYEMLIHSGGGAATYYSLPFPTGALFLATVTLSTHAASQIQISAKPARPGGTV